MSSYPWRRWHYLPRQQGYTFRPSALIVLGHSLIGLRSREQLEQHVWQVKTWYEFESIICLVRYALQHAPELVKKAG